MVRVMKSPNMMSTTGRRPVIAAPTAIPVNPASEIGVSSTRSLPNSSSKPERTLKGVPASAVFPGILGGMIRWLNLALHLAVAGLKSRRSLLLELLALQHQLLVLSRSSKRPGLTPLDRVLWAWLSQAWGGWKSRLCLVQPSTVLQWHRAGFRLFWRWKSGPHKS